MCLSLVLAYRDEEGQPWVLPVVKTIEAQMSSDPLLNHEYLPIDGLKSFTEAATRLVLGTESLAITQNRVRTKHYISYCIIIFSIVPFNVYRGLVVYVWHLKLFESFL